MSRGCALDRDTRHPTLPAGIRLDDASVDSETFTHDQTGSHAASQHFIKQPMEQIAFTERAMSMLREGRMIEYFIL